MRHLRRLTRLYGERHDFMVQEMDRCMPKAFTLLPGDAGLTIYAVWNGDRASYERFTKQVHEQGVLFRDVERYRLMPGRAAICFGFAHLEKAEIREGVRRMQTAWEKCTFSFR